MSDPHCICETHHPSNQERTMDRTIIEITFDSANDPADPGNRWSLTVNDNHKWLFALDRIPFKMKLRARLLTRAKAQGRKKKQCNRLEMEMLVASLDPRQRIEFALWMFTQPNGVAKVFIEEWATGAYLTLTVGRRVRR